MAGHRFESRTVMVTGAGSGIGRAIALAFANEGANVAVVDFNASAGAATVDAITAAGGNGRFFQADISSEQQVATAIEAITSAYGGLHSAINCAAVDVHSTSLVETTEAIWDRVIDINLKGTFFCLKYQIPAMLAAGGGTIINISSMAGLLGGKPGISAYVSSKHGVVGLTRNAALEWISQGVRINAICPGAVKTPLLDSHLAVPGTAEAIRQENPIGRWGEPEEIAAIALFLASDESSYIVGQPIAADGGLSLH